MWRCTGRRRVHPGVIGSTQPTSTVNRVVLRRVFLVRHSKSSWSCDIDDHERPLSGRGRRDAAALGRYLQRRRIEPDLVWHSPAVRAARTWQIAAAHGATAARVESREALYHASAEALLSELGQVDAAVRTLLVVGHNDGLADCVALLGDRSGPAHLWTRIEAKYPTSACAELALPAWSGLVPGQAELISYEIPRG